jgi:N6-adenosine-specific RNA methylase IME4
VTTPDEGYPCTSIDSPWNERGGGKVKRGADRHYDLLKTPDIIRVILTSPLWKPAANAHLWLWVTNNFLRDGLLVMDALGFRYVTNLAWGKMRWLGTVGERDTWVADRGGTGQYLRGCHELCLFGVRGRLKGQSKSARSFLPAARTRKHSQKPAEAYAVMEEVSPGPRAELFATEGRLGWDCWGMVKKEEKTWWATACSGFTSPVDVTGVPEDEQEDFKRKEGK